MNQPNTPDPTDDGPPERDDAELIPTHHVTPDEADDLDAIDDAADDDVNDPDAESIDFAARVMAAAQVVRDEAVHPDLPLRDGFGYEWVELRCFACGRTHHMVEDAYALYRARGVKPLCLPHQSPDLFKWRTNPDTGIEYIQPIEGARKKLVGETESGALERLGYERIEKQDRREFLRELKERVDLELSQVEARIVALETEIPAAQDALEKAMNDPDRELKQQIADLEKQIAKSSARHDVLKTRARRERSAR